MNAQCLNPILNVSDINASFAWFEKLGWRKAWAWGEHGDFGGVVSGECEIFLCQNGQGSRGKGQNTETFGPQGNDHLDKGVWMSVFVENVDAVHARCVEQGLDVTFTPHDMPWSVREMHVRHPDGHVFRISQSLSGPDEEGEPHGGFTS